MNGSLWKNVVAGAVGGLSASYVMNQFRALTSGAAKALQLPGGDPQQSNGAGDDATVKTAQAISQNLFDHHLTAPEKKWAGPAVHYAFGTLVGAVYGALAATVPGVSRGRGTLYGTAVWLAADEVGVPAAGLGPSPSDTPASGHLKALASHLVYGFTTDLTKRALQRAMNQ